MLFDDGDYKTSETPAKKGWEAIERVKLWCLMVDDDGASRATTEQARVHDQ